MDPLLNSDGKHPPSGETPGAGWQQISWANAPGSRRAEPATVVRPLARAPEPTRAHSGQMFSPIVRAHTTGDASQNTRARDEIRAKFENLVRASPCPKALLSTSANTGAGSLSAFSPVAIPSKADQDPVLARLISRSCISAKQPVSKSLSPLQLSGPKGILPPTITAAGRAWLIRRGDVKSPKHWAASKGDGPKEECFADSAEWQGLPSPAPLAKLPLAGSSTLQSNRGANMCQQPDMTSFADGAGCVSRTSPSTKAIPMSTALEGLQLSKDPAFPQTEPPRGREQLQPSVTVNATSDLLRLPKSAKPSRLQTPGISTGPDWVGAFPAFSVAQQQRAQGRLARDTSLQSDSCIDSEATELSEDERGSDSRQRRSAKAKQLDNRPSERSAESPAQQRSLGKAVSRMEEEQLQDGEDGFRSGSRSAGGDTLSKNNGSTAAGLVDRSQKLAPGTNAGNHDNARQSLTSRMHQSAASQQLAGSKPRLIAPVNSAKGREEGVETGESEGELGMLSAGAIIHNLSPLNGRPGHSNALRSASLQPLGAKPDDRHAIQQAETGTELSTENLTTVGLLEDRLGMPAMESSGSELLQRRQNPLASSPKPHCEPKRQELLADVAEGKEKSLVNQIQRASAEGPCSEQGVRTTNTQELAATGALGELESHPTTSTSLPLDSAAAVSDASESCQQAKPDAELQLRRSSRLQPAASTQAGRDVSLQRQPEQPGSPPPTWTVTKKRSACSPRGQESNESLPPAKQKGRTSSGLGQPERGGTPSAETPLDILARAVLDTSTADGRQPRKKAAKGADGIGQGAAKRLEKPGHLEKTTPPKHAGTALLPELSRSATPKQHDGLAALVPVLLPQQQAGLASPQKQPQPLQDGDKPRESAVETTILPCTSAREDELALSADVGSDPEDLSQGACHPEMPLEEPAWLGETDPLGQPAKDGSAVPGNIEQHQTLPQAKKRRARGERELDGLLSSAELGITAGSDSSGRDLRRRSRSIQPEQPATVEEPLQEKPTAHFSQDSQPGNSSSQTTETAEQHGGAAYHQEESDGQYEPQAPSRAAKPPLSNKRLAAAKCRVTKQAARRPAARPRKPRKEEAAAGVEPSSESAQPRSPLEAGVKPEPAFTQPNLQVSRTGRIRAPPVAFWANQSLHRDPKSGEVKVRKGFADCLKFEASRHRSANAQPRAPLVDPKVLAKAPAEAAARKASAKPAAPKSATMAKLEAVQSKELLQKPKHQPKAVAKPKAQPPKSAPAPGIVLKKKQRVEAKPESPAEDGLSEEPEVKEQGARSLAECAAAAGRAAAQQSDAARDNSKVAAEAQLERRQPGNSLEGEPSGASDPSARTKTKRAAGISSRSEASGRPKGFMRKKSRLQQVSLPEDPEPVPAGQMQDGGQERPSDSQHSPTAKKRRADEACEVEREVSKAKGKVGVYPRCEVCKRQRPPKSFCGTDSALPKCLNREGNAAPSTPVAAHPAVKRRGRPPKTVARLADTCAPVTGRKRGRPTKADSKAEPKQPEEDLEASEGSPDDPTDSSEAEEAGTEEDLEQDGWTESQVRALQAAWMRDVNPTAPGFWQRVAKKVGGAKTAAECHDKYMSLFGDTPAPKAAKARVTKSATKARKLIAGKKPSKVQMRKMARDARWQQRSVDATPSQQAEELRERQRQTDRYLDALLNRPGSKGFASAGFGSRMAQRAGGSALASRGTSDQPKDLTGQITSILAVAARAAGESDDEEEKDHYFSDG